ncbi:MAG: radical SAM protein, partial [bacterium]|nr:radical SAM protein [bacterium]
LRCLWCQNPESQNPAVETFFFPENCINCGNCRKGKDCNSLARRVVGKYYPPSELSEILIKDKVYYETSKGGVTFSGGEPLLFPEYLHEVAKTLKKEDIHIAVETCGYFDFQLFEETCLPFIDFIFYDIKIMTPVKHKQYTGKSNELIIQNFNKILNKTIEMIPRIPLVPDYTATEENVAQITELFKQLNIEKYWLLPYNPSGLDKWKRLGKTAPADISAKPMSMKEEARWRKLFKDMMPLKNAITIVNTEGV